MIPDIKTRDISSTAHALIRLRDGGRRATVVDLSDGAVPIPPLMGTTFADRKQADAEEQQRRNAEIAKHVLDDNLNLRAQLATRQSA